jgi:hypothetical protein
MTEVTYRGRTLALTVGEEEALLNGYPVTLPAAAEKINGCLYADEKLLSAYFTGDVDFNIESRQVTLQTKDSTTPVLAVKKIFGEADDRAYSIEVPVIVGLNDSKYEESLNEKNMQEMQDYAEAFLMEKMAETGDGVLHLKMHAEMCTKDFVSLYWEGTKDGISVKFAKNFDLLGQKEVTLADMLSDASLEKVKYAAGEGWTEDRFCLTAEGGLVLLKGSNENSQNMYYWTTEGEQPQWKDAYQSLFSQK